MNLPQDTELGRICSVPWPDTQGQKLFCFLFCVFFFHCCYCFWGVPWAETSGWGAVPSLCHLVLTAYDQRSDQGQSSETQANRQGQEQNLQNTFHLSPLLF